MTSSVVIITGAARGIGKATALLLASQHNRLILSGRDQSALDEVADAVAKAGGDAQPVVGDIQSPEAAVALVEQAQRHFGPVDGLVNAAGIAKNVPLLDLDLETWNSLFSLHATATFLCSQAVARAMVAQGQGGSIINLSSMAASMAMYGTGAYGAAKAAVSSLTRAFAVELAQFDIRVNAVAPGPVATDQLMRAYGPVGFADRGRSIPMNRLATPENVADLISFLLSDRSVYITGQVLAIDGGSTAVGAYSYDTYKRNVVPAEK
jgi:NAD(P)-dependent dehydrogenase (short-subunit alcohol dehydrogenase family)